jgi:hypothetical protein
MKFSRPSSRASCRLSSTLLSAETETLERVANDLRLATEVAVLRSGSALVGVTDATSCPERIASVTVLKDWHGRATRSAGPLARARIGSPPT